MIVLRILTGLAICLWILFLWRRRRFYKLMFQINGPKGLPLIGVGLKFRSLEEVNYVAEAIRKEYTFPFLSWIGTLPVFVLDDPINAQDILTSPNCVNKALFYSVISEGIGLGLITSGNPRWALHRKWLNMAFSPTNQRNFLHVFNEKTKGFLDKFDASYNGEPIEILPMFLKLTMNIALETTMGLKSDHKREETEDMLFRYYHCLEKYLMKLIFMPWLRLSVVKKYLPSMQDYTSTKLGLKSYYKNLIQEKMEFSTTNDKTTVNSMSKKDEIDNEQQRSKFTFMELAIDLLKSGKFTRPDVEDHCNHIVAGAFETTAGTISNAILLLAMHPQYQQIAFEELASVFPDRDNITVTEEDLQRLVYLEMVINETLRLLPTVPIVARSVEADTKLSSGIVLPKGVQILIDIFDLHRSKECWGPNALAFNPENFLPDNIRSKHPYAFIPFTKGIRTCIGIRYGMNSSKIVLAMILRKYRFTTDGELDKLVVEPTISIRIVNVPFVQFHLREK